MNGPLPKIPIQFQKPQNSIKFQKFNFLFQNIPSACPQKSHQWLPPRILRVVCHPRGANTSIVLLYTFCVRVLKIKKSLISVRHVFLGVVNVYFNLEKK